MSIFTLLALEDAQIETVTAVVRQWCADYHVSLDTARGKAAVDAAVNRALTGETAPEALREAIGIEMRLEQYRNPLD